MEENKGRPNNRRKKIAAFIIFPLLIVIGAVILFFYREYKATHISTDDAFVDGRVHTIASKISGTVKVIYVNDNQFIKKGDPILEIDPTDYDVRMKEAQAGLETERAKLSEIRDRVDTAKKQLEGILASMGEARANLELQEANLRQAEVDFKRAESLLKKEVIPREQYDKAKTTYDVAAAQVKAAKERIKQLEASLETQKAVVKQTETSLIPQQAQIQQKEASLKGTELNLGYTKIYAPTDGYITKRTVEVGNQVQVGQPLLAVVPLAQDDIWISANYKETQLEKVKPGQKVEIKVDTFPGKKFYGRVESIMSGTGAAFSLLPPENATGNYVKIVQRIPVKIILDQGTDPSHNLRIGMSVVPTILVNSK
jgi:membrane fusion protein (multidrug efflux system)